MATARFWRAVGVGYFTTGEWAGEMATTGISGVAVDGGGNFGTAIGQQLPQFEANPSGASKVAANYTVFYGSEGTGDWTQTRQDQIADIMITFLGAIKTLQASAFRWTDIVISAYSYAGAGAKNPWPVVNGGSIYQLTTPIVGAGSGFSHSPTTACVASLRTGLRGPSGRGRMYIPVHSFNATTGTLASSVRNQVGNATQALVMSLDQLNSVQPAVVSRTRSVYSTINSIEVGDEIDNVRRRRNRRNENYTSFAV